MQDHNYIFYDSAIYDGVGFVVSDPDFVIFSDKDMRQLILNSLTKKCKKLDDESIDFEDMKVCGVIYPNTRNSLLKFLSDDYNATISSNIGIFQKKLLLVESNTREVEIKNLFDKESIIDHLKFKYPVIFQSAISSSKKIDRISSPHYKEIVFHDGFIDEFDETNTDIQGIFLNKLIEIVLFRKKITENDVSDESATVKADLSLAKKRTVNFSGFPMSLFWHVKLPKGYRLYFKEEGCKLLIGHITLHLPTANF